MSTEEEKQDTEIPAGQKFFDNYFLLLIISILISGLLYNAWGLIELLRGPIFP
jgi:hypothetical protein